MYKYKAIRKNVHRLESGKCKYFAKGDVLETNEKKGLGKKDLLKHFELVGTQNDTPIPQVDQNINPAVLEGQIQAAIDKLDKDNDEHWTAAGSPRMDVINGFLGREITRTELNEASPGLSRDSV